MPGVGGAHAWRNPDGHVAAFPHFTADSFIHTAPHGDALVDTDRNGHTYGYAHCDCDAHADNHKHPYDHTGSRAALRL
ncbi:MAG: hypothetical protein OXB89_01530 [Anaerolineaceae bacterium]|nr:hypothetical protein [Anaerolineaceae bacterium]